VRGRLRRGLEVEARQAQDRHQREVAARDEVQARVADRAWIGASCSISILASRAGAAPNVSASRERVELRPEGRRGARQARDLAVERVEHHRQEDQPAGVLQLGVEQRTGASRLMASASMPLRDRQHPAEGVAERQQVGQDGECASCGIWPRRAAARPS
jgi:hypothetical protein